MHAGVKNFKLGVIDAALSEDHERVLSINTDIVLPTLRNYVAAFDAGYLSIEKLLEILVFSFVKLSQKINVTEKANRLREGPGVLAEKITRNALLQAWKQALIGALMGETHQYAGDATIHYYVPSMPADKHAKLVRAMLKANFAQVC